MAEYMQSEYVYVGIRQNIMYYTYIYISVW